jgi:argininosuccinate lyase
MKLWDKGYNLDQTVEAFMAGDDPSLDQALVKYDCVGSIAHAHMLEKIGVLTQEEYQRLAQELCYIIQLDKKGEFLICQEDEDVHTACENFLVKQLGDLGKKLHTARSRNDQVLLDLRLYSRDWLLNISEEIMNVAKILCQFADTYKAVPVPGRTHFQRAMPSSLGLWSAAFMESLLDDIELIKSAYWLNDQCPLGSAASYGVSLPIDRQAVSDFLGFRTVQNNVLYANNSRGKFEAVILHALSQVMSDLSKMSTDIILFCAPEFGYLVLPENVCPGSSLMPQKRNPCSLELIRAKSATVQGRLFQVLDLIRALPSGYNRDFQETKRPLFEGFQAVFGSLKAFACVFSGLQVNKERCIGSFSSELFATDAVLELVKNGIPFRDAYRQIASHPDRVNMEDPVANILSKTHQGATGNLGLEMSLKRMKVVHTWIEMEKEKNGSVIKYFT